MTISVRLNDNETELIKNDAKMNNISFNSLVSFITAWYNINVKQN